MKKNSLLLIFLLFAVQCIWSQTTETFETEAVGSSSFTDNGQIFNITSQAPAIFDVYQYSNGGWNGTGIDSRFIDNSGTTYFNTPVQFTISASGGTNFYLKSIYLFLSKSDLGLNVSGSCIITGKLAGVTKFTVTQNSPFNTSMGVANGFTQVNLSNYGGQDNSNTAIDQYVITTTGNIAYVSLDAMRWQCAAPTVSLASVTNIACYGGNTGAISVNASNGVTYDWTPGNPPGDGTPTITGLTAGTYTCMVTSSCGTALTTVTVTQPSSAITASQSQTNVSCNGGNNGTATVIASGGTGSYTYSWSPSGGNGPTANGRYAGNYTVTITDTNGCSTQKFFSITQENALTATQSQTNVSCNGGSNGTATVVASGGTGSYTYSWSPMGGNGATASSLPAGNYTATITDANSCSIQKNFTITAPAAALSATGNQTNVRCYGGSDGLIYFEQMSGGTAPYTILWSNGATSTSIQNITAGNYTATITDAKGCTLQKNFIITEPAALSVNTTITNIACNGGATGAVYLNISGGTAPYAYQWSNGSTSRDVSGLTAGTYSVTVTDANGCSASKSVYINQSPALSATTSQTNTCGSGATGSATVEVSGGQGPYTYSWAPSGGNSATATNLSAGTYQVIITDIYGCTVSRTVTITGPATSLAVTATGTNITCNNAFDGTATANVSGGLGNYTYLWSTGAITPTITDLGSGTYTVTVSDGGGCTPVTGSVTITSPESIAAQVTSTQILCNGGTATATVSAVTGGTAPYTYLWSNGATGTSADNLSGGSYNVRVTDASGCVSYINFSIWEPGAINAYNEVNNTRDVTCYGGNDGIADVSHSGGVGPFTYQWLPYGGTNMMATGLSAGDFTVTVTDSRGCNAVVAITIGQPGAITASVQTTDATCSNANGTATATATGGTGNLTYSWSNGATGATVSGLYQGDYSVTVTDSKGCSVTQDFTIGAPESISLNPTQNNLTCTITTGSIALNVTGGVAPYSYAWSTGSTASSISGLAEGGYSVVVTDATGCTTASEFYIYNSEGIYGSAYGTPVQCAGGATGTAQVTIYGGSEGPFTYLWSNGATSSQITNLTAGSYSVFVTAPNGCSATYYVSIGEPQAMDVTVTAVNATCAGEPGSASVTVSGFEGAIDIYWSNGSNGHNAYNLYAGNYTVTVVNNSGCAVTKNFEITAPGVLSASVLTGNVLCYGQLTGAIVEVEGGTAPFTYLWSNGATASNTELSGGTHAVFVTDANGCSTQQSFTITQPDAIIADLTHSGIQCAGNTATASVNVEGGIAPYTYSWSNGATSQSVSGLTAGTQSVTITDDNGCTVSTAFEITAPAALTATLTSVVMNACFGDNDGSAMITAEGGVAPYTYSWSNGTAAVTVSGLAAGIYTGTVTDANGCTASVNLVITEPSAISNDNCATAQQIFLGFTFTNNICATTSAVPNAPCTAGPTAYDVWYKFNSGASTVFTLNTDMPYAIYTGSCNALNQVVCSTGGLTTFNAVANTAYYVRAYSLTKEGRRNFSLTLAVPCTAPTEVAVTNSATSASISWTAAITPPTGGYEYEVRTSGSAGSGASGLAASGNTSSLLLTVNSLTINTTYTVYIRSVCGDGEYSSWTAPTSFYTGFCTPAAAISGGNGITNVSFSTVNNATAAEAGNYGDYSALTGNALRGYSLPVHVTSQTPQYTKIWIDWNNDLDFNDASELVFDGDTAELATTAAIMIHSDAVVGAHRMRIAGGNAAGFTACSSNGNTHYEDYTLNVISGGGAYLTNAFCDAVISGFNTGIYSVPVTAATAYRFRVSGPGGVEVIERAVRFFSLDMLSSYSYSTVYTIDVAVQVGGAWSEYDKACTVTVDGIPTTQLKVCGGTVNSFDSYIFADAVSLATNYRFEIVSSEGTFTLDRPVPWFKLNMLPTYNYGTVYTVRVMVLSNGQWSAYGAACTVSAMAEITPTKLKVCGQVVSSFTGAIYADVVPLASTYNFTVVSSYGTQVISTSQNWFSLSQLSNYDYNENYNVTVTVTVPGAGTSAPGATCIVTSPVQPVTSLKANQCGVVIAARTTGIYCNTVTKTATYRFTITTVGGGVQVLNRTAASFNISMLTGIAAGSTFSVVVQTISPNGSLSATGPACTITLAAGAARPGAQDVTHGGEVKPGIKLAGFPNPFVDSFGLDFTTNSDAQVDIVVYDMTGKLVDKRTVQVSQLPELRVGENFAAGVYNLILTQGDTVKTLRIVKNTN